MGIEVGAGEWEGSLPWNPYSSAEGSSQTPLLPLFESLVLVFIESPPRSQVSSDSSLPSSYTGSSYIECLGEMKHPVSWNSLFYLVNL